MLYTSYGRFNDPTQWGDRTLGVLSWVTSIAFFLLGIVFLWASVGMMNALKLNFKDFYNSYRKLLWTATIVQTAPLFMRTFIILLNQWPAFQKAVDEGDGTIAVYNFFFFLLTTYLPIIF